VGVKPTTFEERWTRVVAGFAERCRKDESIATLRKRHRKLVKKLQELEVLIDDRRVRILGEMVEKEFASK